MGCTYETERIYSKALNYLQQALSIRAKFLVEISSSYNNIGDIYFRLGEYGAAIENYNYAIKIKSKCLSSQDPSLEAILRNITRV